MRAAQRAAGTQRTAIRLMLVAIVVVAALSVGAPAARAKPGGTNGSMKIDSGVAATATTAVVLHSSVSGATQMHFRNAGGSWSAWTPYSATHDWMLAAGDGVKTVEAQYKGAKGKAITKSDTILLDTQAPVVAGLTSVTHPDEAVWYATIDLAVAWSAAADLSGVAGYSWVVDQAAHTVPDAASEGAATSLDATGLTDGLWYVHVRAIDAAGNVGPAVHRAVRVDATAPATNVAAPPGPVRSVTLLLAANDALSGVALVEYRIDGGAWNAVDAVTLNKAIRHRRAGLQAGDHILEYRATDNAGNVEPVRAVTVTLI